MAKYSYKIIEKRSILVEVNAKSRDKADKKIETMISNGELEDELFFNSESEEVTPEFLSKSK